MLQAHVAQAHVATDAVAKQFEIGRRDVMENGCCQLHTAARSNLNQARIDEELALEWMMSLKRMLSPTIALISSPIRNASGLYLRLGWFAK
jgi:hypothetical protein